MKTTSQHLRELVALTLIPKLGAQRIRALLQKVDQPQEIFRLNRSELESIYGIGSGLADEILTFNSWDEADRILEKAASSEYEIMTLADESYPDLLRQIYDPPVLLWIRGNKEVLSHDSVAIVGTRKASAYGKEMARKFSAELVEADLVVVSGLAYGIDAAAHKGTLQAGGQTIAVLGSGIDRIYPSNHIRLANDMIEQGGAVITEFPPGAAPDAGNFPVRNRIVSGLTLGTLVVESGIKGGSMITARSALDQNREVFVVPHSLDLQSGIGNNHLIKTGQGKLIQGIDDILQEIDIHRESEQTTQKSSQSTEKHWRSLELDELSTSICRVLEESPTHVDALVEKLEVPSHQLLAKLLELEMKECVRQQAGKIFQLR